MEPGPCWNRSTACPLPSTSTHTLLAPTLNLTTLSLEGIKWDMITAFWKFRKTFYCGLAVSQNLSSTVVMLFFWGIKMMLFIDQYYISQILDGYQLTLLKLPLLQCFLRYYWSSKFNNTRQEDKGRNMCWFKFSVISHSLSSQYIKSFQCFYSYEFWLLTPGILSQRKVVGLGYFLVLRIWQLNKIENSMLIIHSIFSWPQLCLDQHKKPEKASASSTPCSWPWGSFTNAGTWSTGCSRSITRALQKCPAHTLQGAAARGAAWENRMIIYNRNPSGSFSAFGKYNLYIRKSHRAIQVDPIQNKMANTLCVVLHC